MTQLPSAQFHYMGDEFQLVNVLKAVMTLTISVF